ncbi:MAG: hypothetical protein GY906_40545 [bacterium]|nr:hypothetical protein [bacterium]
MYRALLPEDPGISHVKTGLPAGIYRQGYCSSGTSNVQRHVGQDTRATGRITAVLGAT